MTEKTFTQKIVDIQSRLKAPKDQRNEFGGFSYRSAEDIEAALKPLLQEHQLLLYISDDYIMLPPGGDPGLVKATATITDGKDQLEVSALAREAQTKTKMDASQITGSASSYARKYALCGLFLIDNEKDADSMDNSRPTKKVPTKQAPVFRPSEDPDRATLPAVEHIMDEIGKLSKEKKGLLKEFMVENKFSLGSLVDGVRVNWNVSYDDLTVIMEQISSLKDPL